MSEAKQNKSLKERLSCLEFSKEQLSAAIILLGLSLSQQEKEIYVTQLVDFFLYLETESEDQNEQITGEDLYQNVLASIKRLNETNQSLIAKEVLMPAESSLQESEQKEILYADPQNLLNQINKIYQDFQELCKLKAWQQAAEIGPKLLSLTLSCLVETQNQQQREESYTLDRMAEHGLLSFEPDILGLQSAAALFYALDARKSVPAIYQILSRFSSPLYRLYTFAKPVEGLYTVFLLGAMEWLERVKNDNEKSDKDNEAAMDMNDQDIDQKLEEIKTLLSFIFPKGVSAFAISGSFLEEEKQLQFLLARITQNASKENLTKFILSQLSQEQDSQEIEQFMLKALKSSQAKIHSAIMSKLLKDYAEVQEDLAVFEAREASIECKARRMRTMEEVDELFDFCHLSSPADPEYLRYFTYVGKNRAFGRLKRDLRFVKQAYEQQLYPLACEIGLRLLKLKFEFLNWDDPLDDEQEELEFYELFQRNLMEFEREEFDFFVANSLYLSVPFKVRISLFRQFAPLFDYNYLNLHTLLPAGKKNLDQFQEFIIDWRKGIVDRIYNSSDLKKEADEIWQELYPDQKPLAEIIQSQ